MTSSTGWWYRTTPDNSCDKEGAVFKLFADKRAWESASRHDLSSNLLLSNDTLFIKPRDKYVRSHRHHDTTPKICAYLRGLKRMLFVSDCFLFWLRESKPMPNYVNRIVKKIIRILKIISSTIVPMHNKKELLTSWSFSKCGLFLSHLLLLSSSQQHFYYSLFWFDGGPWWMVTPQQKM